MATKRKGSYREPPEETRFKPGQSGNPRGRPKGGAEILAEGHAILSEPVQARTADGKVETLESLEASYLSLCRKGLKGHVPSLIDAIRTAITVVPAAAAEAQAAKRHQFDARRKLAEKMGFPVPAYMLEEE